MLEGRIVSAFLSGTGIFECQFLLDNSSETKDYHLILCNKEEVPGCCESRYVARFRERRSLSTAKLWTNFRIS